MLLKEFLEHGNIEQHVIINRYQLKRFRDITL